MKNRKLGKLHFLVNVLVVSVMTSCSLNSPGPSASDLLTQLGIDQSYFAKLPTCEQVRVYSYLGPYFGGVRLHDVTPLPWMAQVLSDNTKETPLCLINEASERLNQEGLSDNRYRLEALNNLIEKMQLDYLASRGLKGADFTSPEAQRYLENFVCGGLPAPYLSEAVRTLYMSRNRSYPWIDHPPTMDAFSIEGIEKMKKMFCK